ncbi:hypothetical protein ACQR2B_27980 [Bradyrhizobium oligotrophicum]|uniref:hypothetical protein n=1 Tax=Bradyrhizobium TaxID=374 RepID=UPI003EBC9A7B
MSGKLWIGDGSSNEGLPNFRNPYIWVVPGDDPYGSPGQAQAKKTNYVWARVSNTDTQGDADGAFVDFYFQTFSVALGKRTIKLIGTSQVDLPHQSDDNVLCVVPFVPAAGGHGCLVCVIRHVLDPLPAGWDIALRSKWLSQVGQRNIEVIDDAPGNIRVIPFEAAAPYADSDRIMLEITRPNIRDGEIRQLLWSSGLSWSLGRTEGVARVGLSESATPSQNWWQVNSLTLQIPRGESRFLFLLSETLPGAPAFDVIDVVAIADGRRSGGVAALIVRK